MAEILERLTPHLADRYQLLRVAARGGTSVIVYAEDVRHSRPVAIKVFSGEFTSLAGADRFLREIGILARLQHPNILPLIDSGAADGMLYYVMPFVQGESLRQKLVRETRVPVQETVRLVLEICDALRYAHEQGLVHRDIKPENIMLASRHALVTDFGVARAMSASSGGDSSRTTAGLAIGTPAYMSPEQAAADPSTDHRADIYAIGILAYEMLAGRPPFSGDSAAQILASHVMQPPTPLAALRPDLPPGLDAVIMKCLAKRPADRYQSAAELSDALEPYLLPSGSLTPVGTKPVGIAERRRWVLALTAAGAVAVIAFMLLAKNQQGPALQLGDPKRLGATGELELDPVLSPDGRLLAYAAGVNGAMRIQVRQVNGGDPIKVAQSVSGNQRWPRWAPDGSRIAFQSGGSIYTVPALGGPAETIVEGPPSAPVVGYDWSPDGARIAWFAGGLLRVQDVNSTGPPTELLTDPQAHSVAWSPDGAWIAFVRGNADFVFSETLLGNVAPSQLMLIAAGGGTPIALTDGRQLAVSPAWLDRRTLLYVQGRAGIRDVFRLRIKGNGQPEADIARLTTGLGPHGIVTSTSGTLVYSVLSHESNVWSVPLPARGSVTVREAEPVTTGQQLVEDMDVLPGGGWMLYDSNLDGSQDIWLMSLQSNQPIQLTRDSTEEFGPTWSPNGKEIAYYGIRDGVRQVFVMRAGGKGIRQVTSDTLQHHQPRWSPDGEHLVFNATVGPGTNRVFVVDRKADSSWTAPRSISDDVGAGANWSSDGRWIAFADPEGHIRVVSPEGGKTRVIAGPETVTGQRFRRPLWLLGEPILLARAEAPGGQGGIWMVPVDGGSPRELVKFDDPARPVYRDDFASDGDRIFFTISELSSSLWSAPLNKQ
jgi:serine/threonine-protein kinase